MYYVRELIFFCWRLLLILQNGTVDPVIANDWYWEDIDKTDARDLLSNGAVLNFCAAPEPV